MSQNAPNSSNGQDSQSQEELLKGFESLLICIAETSDTQKRRQAEESLAQACNDNALLYLECLLQILIGSSNEGVRQLSTILFRQNMEPNIETLSKVSSQSWVTFQTALMTALTKEQSKLVYLSICDCIGTFGSRILPQGGWESLLPDLLKLTQMPVKDNQVYYHKQGFLRVLKGLGEYAIEYLKQHMQTVHELFNNALKDDSTEVRIEAFKAFVSVMVSLTDSSMVRQFMDTMKISLDILKVENDETIQSFMADMIALTDNRAALIEPYLNELVGQCVAIINNGNAEFKTRQLCLEELINICDTLGQTVRKNGDFCHQLLKLLMLFCAEYDDSLDFSDPADDEEQSFVFYGKDGLYSVSETLGATVYFQASKPLVLEWLNSNNWKQVYAALWTLVKGLPNMKDLKEFDIRNYKTPISFNNGKFMLAAQQTNEESKMNDSQQNTQNNKIQLVDNIILKICDLIVTHNRNEVKYVAIIALNIFSSEFDQEFHMKYYDIIFNIINGILQDYTKFHHRVALQTIRLLAQFNADCPQNAFTPFSDNILQHLSVVVTQEPPKSNDNNNNNNNNENKTNSSDTHTNKYELHEEACIAIGQCAKLLGNNFLRYYDRFFGIMVKLLETCKNPENQSLRGKAMECIGLMGESVGNMKFSQDAHKLMQVLLPLRNELERSDDNTAYTHLNHLFARIGRIIGDDFVQYFDRVIPHIMNSARVEAIRIAAITDPDPVDGNLQVIKFHVRGKGDSKLFMSAPNLNEKQNACHMLYQFCKDHPIGYFPYLIETANILFPLMRYPYSARIRVAASAISPLILKSIVLVSELDDNSNNIYKQMFNKNENNLQKQLFDQFDRLLGGLLQALTLERDIVEQVPLLEILTKFIAIAGKSNGLWVLTESQMNEITEDLEICFSESFERRQNIAKRYGTPNMPKNLFTRDSHSDISDNNNNINGDNNNNNNDGSDKDSKLDDKMVNEISLLSEIEDNLISGCIDVIEWLFRTRKEAFTPYFDKYIAKHAMTMLECKLEWQNQKFHSFQWDIQQMRVQGLCLMIDAIELGGELAIKKYLQWFHSHFEELCNSNDYQTKQTSIFAVGMVAQLGVLPNAQNIWFKQFNVFCTEFKSRLNMYMNNKKLKENNNNNSSSNEELKTAAPNGNGNDQVSEEDSVDEEDIEELSLVYDNCCSAMGKILRFMPFDSEETQFKHIKEWIMHLPVQHDEDEVHPSLENLVAFMEKYGSELIKNSDLVGRIIYSVLYWLSSYQRDPNRFDHILRYDFNDDIKTKAIRVPLLTKDEATKACLLLNKLKQSVSNNIFENVDARFTVQEKFQRQTICRMYGIE